MSATYTCESCGTQTPEAPCYGYDRSPEGQGRCRLITLCDGCVVDYLHALWNLTPGEKPERAYARQLGGALTRAA